MTLTRSTMRLTLAPFYEGGDLLPDAEPATAGDREGLARLMLDAYRGTADAEGGETLTDALGEMDNLFAGEYGSFLPEGSSKLVRGGEIVSATLVTLLRDAPFLAFVMTHPEYKRRGLARKLLLRSCWALSAQGHAELTLVVTRANDPALRLYQRLGFVTLPAPIATEGTHG